jgi:hypothetical protein
MSALEARARLQLWAMGLPYAVYFMLQLAIPAWFEGLTILQRLACFGATALVHAAITLTGLVLLRRKPGDDGPRLDERDRAIEARATLAGYYTLMAAMIMVGVMLPFGAANPWKIVNAALLGIVIAEMVRHALIAMAYRKAARFAH